MDFEAKEEEEEEYTKREEKHHTAFSGAGTGVYGMGQCIILGYLKAYEANLTAVSARDHLGDMYSTHNPSLLLSEELEASSLGCLGLGLGWASFPCYPGLC